MNKLIISRISAVALFIAGCLSRAVARAEGADINVNVARETTPSIWYASPWVWIVGAAVFVLLLAAILNGGRRSAD